ncbi:30S ribosomal protein S20 [Aerococcus urinaehominis]|uniref:Small ribosomal subunit protein bS20 n=1 Tax=Aerococcus urinaehominis TaxID=128944 RepID=A0A109RGF9_9LACT|nr:30S ribosomal protein S20 [Aerococcus urinaehominis]AMB98996.1 30S ribosomal protein S20 [Aerococcus urinaehominis]SDM62202.1 SSU ribosomal protein S20P [Aerococcus urinaehominis]
MANIASAIKRARQNDKVSAQNHAKKNEMRTAIKRYEQAVSEGADNAQELLVHANKLIDQAASKNLIHANKAARDKSRLAKKANA